MKRHSSIHILNIVMVMLVLLSGCERRPLDDEKAATALIPFAIDWSQSGLDVSAMKRASIWFFPHDGKPSFEWRMQGDLSNAIVPLPEGKYSIVIFNETIDETDWDAVVFEGKDKYETFSVYTQKGEFKGLFTRAEDADIRKTPEALASWSLPEFEVTLDMITYTNNQTTKSENLEAVTKSLDKLTSITPKPLTVNVNIKAHIQNLKNSLRCSASFNGATGKISLATGKPMPGEVTHVFVMNNRKYDPESPTDGTIEANLLLFKLVEADVKYELQLDFQMLDGFKVPTHSFDITDKFSEDKTTVQVDVGIEESTNDHPVILPSVELENEVGIDNWDDMEIIIY